MNVRRNNDALRQMSAESDGPELSFKESPVIEQQFRIKPLTLGEIEVGSRTSHCGSKDSTSY